jgi:hypothetical protein
MVISIILLVHTQTEDIYKFMEKCNLQSKKAHIYLSFSKNLIIFTKR